MRYIACTALAPASIRASAALQSVPPESTISSTSMQVRSFTSPIICITSETPARSRLLSMIARSVSRRFANASPDYASNIWRDHNKIFFFEVFFNVADKDGCRKRLSSGISKKPCIWPACKVHCKHAVRARDCDQISN